MNKSEIKKILMSLRTPENESKVNSLLGKIDLLPDEKITTMVSQIGDSEEKIKDYLQRKLEEKHENKGEPHTPINSMFTFGITGESIHLHMPVNLHQMMQEKGMSRTMDFVNLKLLDAIEKIRKLQKDGHPKFQGKENIYMISPILIGREMRFLSQLDFKTQTYKKKDLQDDKFVGEHPEALLASTIFGSTRDVGTAVIGLDVINSEQWQEKRKAQIKAFEEKGIKLDEEVGRE